MPESIRLFALCDAMKWNHLPWPGALYDQHPKLLDDFYVIFQKRNEHQLAEHKKTTQQHSKAAEQKHTAKRRASRR